MKLCLYTQSSDVFKEKKSTLETVNNFVIKDEKHKMFEDLSIGTILEALKKSGVDGLEMIFPRIPTKETIEKTKNLVAGYKMSVHSIHQSNDCFWNISMSDIEVLCKTAREISANTIVLHIDALKDNLFKKDFITNLKKLQKTYGVKFGIENMPKSPYGFMKPYTYETTKFSDVVENTGLGITFDTTHLGQIGENINDFYLKNKEKIVNIHLSDFRKTWRNQKLLTHDGAHLQLGTGELPIKEFLKNLKNNNYQGNITMEIDADLDGLCESAKMIKDAFR